MPGGAFVATSDYNTFNSTKCIGYRGDDALGACNSRYTCDDLVSVYFDFNEDTYYSKDSADCSCGIAGEGTCACCNPGLFNSSGAGQHCAGGICIYPDPGNDPNDCDASVTPELTYTISGYTTPAADTVNITNLNNSKKWAASIFGNFYNLTLNVGEDVNATEILQIVACDEFASDEYKNESNCNVSDHVPQNIPGEDTNVNLTLNHYCLRYHSYPYKTWEQSNWSGPAVMQMMIDHYRPLEPSQEYLNMTGIAHNQGDCNENLSYVDPRGMWWTLNDILHNTSSYGGGKYANYGIGSYNDNLSALHYICYWQHLGPAPVPAYGDYSNWMAIRGIHTSEDPYPQSQGSYDIYGFWINDPYNETLEGPGGIGENTYKTVDQWTSGYYFSLTDVRDCDGYKNKYVAVCEPPEQPDREVRLVHARPRFTDAITPELMGKPLMVYDVEQLASEKAVKDDESLKIVQAAIDGVTEELIPYDAEFTATFAKTTAGEPMLVTDDDGNDYYIVPFNVPVEVKQVTKMPVEIERVKASGLKKFERVKNVAAKAVIEPIPIEPMEVENTLVVVLVDAEDGSFKEASWVKEPVKYLPISKAEALELALRKMDILSARDLSNLKSKPTIELVYRDASPYYPDWKITVDGKVFFVSQDGTVS